MAQVSLGMAYLRAGDPNRAISHMEEGFRLSPLDFRIANEIGLLLVRQGSKAEAARYFEEALRINPSYEKARRRPT